MKADVQQGIFMMKRFIPTFRKLATLMCHPGIFANAKISGIWKGQGSRKCSKSDSISTPRSFPDPGFVAGAPPRDDTYTINHALKGLLFVAIFLAGGMATHAQQTRILRIGTQSVTLTSDKRSSPALVVQMPEGDIWYGYLTTGTAPGRLTVQMPGGQIHSLTPPPLVHGEFQVTLNNMPTNSQFSLQISAAGNFEIDWGLGTTPQVINKTNTTLTTYTSPASPRYASGRSYTVIIRGRATSYNADVTTPAITFQNSTNLANIVGIAGDLGSIFPILNTSATGSPRFNSTFQNCTGLTGSIPPNLFAGVQGPPVSYMFWGTFWNCANLTGPIPEGLFAGIQGPPAAGMFADTFSGCSRLTGEIPGNLFAGIQGRPINHMFGSTFRNCVGLTGEIPGNLFIGIQGAPADSMFHGAFSGATGLTGIGMGLFDGISGAAQPSMFVETFNGATGLRGDAARLSNGQLLHQRWPFATAAQVGTAFRGATGLNNFTSIPAAWR